MYRRLAAEGSACELAAAIGNYLVDVHVELRAAAGHPHMQREHLVVLPGQNLVASLHDQPVNRAVQPSTCMVGVGGRLLQDWVGSDHLPRDQVLADAEMLQRPLRLRSPESIGLNFHFSPRIALDAPSIRVVKGSM